MSEEPKADRASVESESQGEEPKAEESTAVESDDAVGETVVGETIVEDASVEQVVVEARPNPVRVGVDAAGLATLQDMYRRWPFWRALVDNAQMILSKADMTIARLYADLVLDQQPWLQGYLPIVQICLTKIYKFAGLYIDTGSGIIDKSNLDPLIPLDEVIQAAKDVSGKMPREHRCTSLGGLAVGDDAEYRMKPPIRPTKLKQLAARGSQSGNPLGIRVERFCPRCAQAFDVAQGSTPVRAWVEASLASTGARTSPAVAQFSRGRWAASGRRFSRSRIR